MPFAQKLKISALLGLAGFVLPGLSFADTTYSWYFGSKSSPYCQANCFGESHTKTFNPVGGTSPDVVASGWANTEPNGNNNQLAAADIEIHSEIHSGSGLGVSHRDGETSSSPQHAVDNHGRYELVMFDFGAKPISLTEIRIGWFQNDADISVLAYEGSDTPPTLSGVDYSGSSEGLTGSDWTLVGNYAVTEGTDGAYAATIDTSVKSSYWIVAAYNNVFDSAGCTAKGVANPSCEDGRHKYDYFKIKKVTGKHRKPPPPGEVPVPGTLLLTALGVTLLARRHRERSAR